MIRTIITPTNQEISLNIPSSFVRKKVEVIIFTIEEAKLETSSNEDTILTHFASEPTLLLDWLTKE